MKLIEVLDTIQMFQPGDSGDGEQRDLCGEIAACPWVSPVPATPESYKNCFCEICPFSREAYFAEALWLADPTYRV